MRRFLLRILFPSALSAITLYIAKTSPGVYGDVVYWVLLYMLGLGGTLSAILFIPYAVTVKLTGGVLKPAGYEELKTLLAGVIPLSILYIGILGTMWYSSLAARTGSYLLPLFILPAIIAAIVIMSEYLRSPRITAFYKTALYFISFYVAISAVLQLLISVYTIAAFILNANKLLGALPGTLMDIIPLLLVAISAAISAAITFSRKARERPSEGAWAPLGLAKYFAHTALRRLGLEYRIPVSDSLLVTMKDLLRAHESLREVKARWRSR